MMKSNTSESESKTETALKDSEQRYRTTMMSVGDGVIATDTEGRVDMMNPVAEELTGWKQEEARGKSLEKIFHIINEETRRTVENPVRRVMREGIVVGLANHSVLIAKDGTEHPIADSGSPIRNENGDITGVVLVFRDQTQERTAQKALQESEHKFRETVKNLDEGYYSCMMDGVLLDHNQAFNRILGIDISKDMKGSKLPDFWLNPDDRKAYLQELMTRGFIRNYLINAKTISGEKVVVLVNSHLVKDEKGGLVRIDGTYNDFTKLKLTEEALKESETKYRMLFENVQVGMYRTKIDGSAFLDVNYKFAEIIGFSREELLGTAGSIRWADPGDRDKMMKLLKEQGGILSNYEARVLDKNREVRDVLASIELHPDEGFLDGTMVDITDRKLAEEQLRKLNRIYSLLSDINQAIVRTRVPEELFKQVCNIAVEQGGFGIAWIGLIDESSQKLRVIAQSGRSNGYFEHTNISLNGEPLSYCPIDSALRQGKHSICKIIENKEMAPCQKIVYGLGFRSSASFPLKVSDILKGALTFYSDEPDFFDEAELKLLDELALDISFAMEYAEKEAGRKRVENELRESEEKFRGVFESNILGTLFWNANGDIIAANDAFLEIVGYSREDLISGALKWKELTPSKYDKIDEEKLKELANKGKIDAFEKEYIHKSGRLIPIIISAATLSGSETSGVAIILDITGRKQSEAAERQSRNELDQLFKVSPEMICIVGFDGCFKRLNPAWEKVLGYPTDTMLSKPFIEFVHPNDLEATNYEAAKLSRGESTIRFENRYRSNDGSYRWLSWSVIPAMEEKLLYGVARDVTERKLMEESLSIQKRIGDIFLTVPDDEMFYEVLKVILDLMQSPFGVFGYLDEAGALVVPTMTRQIWNKCQVPEKTFTFPRDTWGNSSWPRAIKEKKTNYSNEISTKTPEGHITLTRHISLPILFQGEVIGLFQVANKETDYTETDLITLESIAGYVAPVLNARLQRQLREKEIRKLNAELEDRVVKRTSQLEASNKELEAFSYSVSHDLRAPLRHVSGYVELLNKHFHSDLPEKGQHYLNSISDSVRIMGMLIDDLLQFSKTGRMEIHQSDLDMNEIVKEVIESLCKDNPDRKIEWVVGKLAYVNGDEAMIRLVWTNLLSNAVKFTRTRKKARIEIGVRKEQKELVFFVRDNGVGFDMQYAQKLFGVFQRLHPTEEFEGTGIGLANVNRIVLRHGGRTWAEAEPGKGAEFNFSIPNNKEEI